MVIREKLPDFFSADKNKVCQDFKKLRNYFDEPVKICSLVKNDFVNQKKKINGICKGLYAIWKGFTK